MFAIAICEDKKYILEETFVFDIILLDMRLLGISGLEVAKRLSRKSRIIFITSYREYALDAFDVDAVHYLMKPITDERLYLALDRAINRLGQADDKALTLTKAGKTQIIPIRDILYCEVFNHRVCLHTVQDTYDYSGTLDLLEKELDERFFRCHRSFIINMSSVVGREKGMAIVSNGDKIFISRRKQSEFMQKLLKFLKSEVT